MQATAGLSDTDARQEYREIASTAESGWDFSSRWGSKTTHVIPADLNSFLLMMEKNMQLFAQVGHSLSFEGALEASALTISSSTSGSARDCRLSKFAGCHDHASQLLMYKCAGTRTNR